MIHKNVDLNRYNADGQEFITRWLSKYEIIGVRYINRGRYEDQLFYKNSDGEIRVAAIPQKNTDSKAVFWGDLDHLTKVIWANVYGWRLGKISLWYDRQGTRRIRRVIDAMLQNVA